MPAKKKKDILGEILRQIEADEKNRKQEYYKSLWKKYQGLVDKKLISPKLAAGAWFLVRNFDYSEAYLWSSRRRDDYVRTPDGDILPQKMIVYREMSRRGYKWNQEEKLWLAK